MNAAEPAKAITDLETSARLLERAAEALGKWDEHYDAENELDAARAIYLKALTLRVLLLSDRLEAQERGPEARMATG